MHLPPGLHGPVLWAVCPGVPQGPAWAGAFQLLWALQLPQPQRLLWSRDRLVSGSNFWTNTVKWTSFPYNIPLNKNIKCVIKKSYKCAICWKAITLLIVNNWCNRSCMYEPDGFHTFEEWIWPSLHGSYCHLVAENIMYTFLSQECVIARTTLLVPVVRSAATVTTAMLLWELPLIASHVPVLEAHPVQWYLIPWKWFVPTALRGQQV